MLSVAKRQFKLSLINLKGFLLLHGQSWAKTHDLDTLCRHCSGILGEPSALPTDFKSITHYHAARYTIGFWPAREVADAALAVAEHVRTIILAAVPPAARPANRD